MCITSGKCVITRSDEHYERFLGLLENYNECGKFSYMRDIHFGDCKKEIKKMKQLLSQAFLPFYGHVATNCLNAMCMLVEVSKFKAQEYRKPIKEIVLAIDRLDTSDFSVSDKVQTFILNEKALNLLGFTVS